MPQSAVKELSEEARLVHLGAGHVGIKRRVLQRQGAADAVAGLGDAGGGVDDDLVGERQRQQVAHRLAAHRGVTDVIGKKRRVGALQEVRGGGEQLLIERVETADVQAHAVGHAREALDAGVQEPPPLATEADPVFRHDLEEIDLPIGAGKRRGVLEPQADSDPGELFWHAWPRSKKKGPQPD